MMYLIIIFRWFLLQQSLRGRWSRWHVGPDQDPFLRGQQEVQGDQMVRLAPGHRLQRGEPAAQACQESDSGAATTGPWRQTVPPLDRVEALRRAQTCSHGGKLDRGTVQLPKEVMHYTLGRVVFSGLFFWLAGLEAPPMRCLKHQKYDQVLIENMERSPIE